MTGVEPGLVQQNVIKQKEWSSGSGSSGPSRPATSASLSKLNRQNLQFFCRLRDLNPFSVAFKWYLLSDIARSKPLDHSNYMTNA